MYALPNKTQHKLIAKVRGGISQKLDNFNTTTSSPSVSTTTTNSSSLSSPISSSSSSLSNSCNSREFSPTSTKFNTNAATLTSKESTTTQATRLSNIDKTISNLELNNCLPQPVFHHTNHGNSRQRSYATRAQKQCITPEHNEMIKYVQQSWKGVERDYKKSVNNYINKIDINGSNSLVGNETNTTTKTSSNVMNDHQQLKRQQNQKQGGKKKTSTTSTPLLLTGSYHHNSVGKDLIGNNRQDSFRPFDLEAFWGNRILKRLTQDL